MQKLDGIFFHFPKYDGFIMRRLLVLSKNFDTFFRILTKIKVFLEERSVSRKKVFTGKSGLNCQKQCSNKFYICPNSPRLEGHAYSYICSLAFKIKPTRSL